MCCGLLLCPFIYALADSKNSTPQADGAPAVEYVAIAPIIRTWEIVKTCVHIAAVLTSIPGIGICAHLMSLYYQNPGRIFIVGIVGLPVLLLTFLWNALELILRANRQWKTGARPASHIASGLIISIITIWLGIGLAGAANSMVHPCDTFNRMHESCDDRDPFSVHVDPAMPASVAAFVLANAAFHLFIFVAGCVDLHRRNKVNKKIERDAAAAAAAAADATAANQPQAQGAEMETVQNGVMVAAPSLQLPMTVGPSRPLQEYYAPAQEGQSAV